MIDQEEHGHSLDEVAAALVADWRRRYRPLLGPWRFGPLRWLATAAVEWKSQDLWIGAYWKRTGFLGFQGYELWICLLPCLPVHFWWYRRIK